MKTLVLTHRGRDDWGRPVYECEGRLYTDICPVATKRAEICTKHQNAFYGEPDHPVAADTVLEFRPFRDVWHLYGPPRPQPAER